MKRLLLLTAALATLHASADKIGEWKAYMAYSDITDIEPAGNMIFVLSSNSIFSYNTDDESITTYDKVSPLSDCTVTDIAWNAAAGRLAIINDNYNIDLLGKDGSVHNIPDYYSKVMTEDKTVNNIMTHGVYAYICTAFGIVKLNMSGAEITDTYNLGRNVSDCTISGNCIYAMTDGGLYKADMSANLLDPDSWTHSAHNVTFTYCNDISLTTAAGYDERYVYDSRNKCYWSNQSDGKLQSYTVNDDNTRTVTRSGIGPEGPRYNYCGFMKMHGGKLYSCNGIGWDFMQPASIQIFDPDSNGWTTFGNEGIAEKFGVVYRDVMSIDIDPSDPKHVFAGTQSGLFEFYDGKVTAHWNDENSPIYSHYKVPEGDKNYEVVSSLIFDSDNNLWVANTGSRRNTLLRLNSDKTWTAMNNAMKGENAGFIKIMGFDEKGFLWMCNNSSEHPAVFRYDPATETLNDYSNWTNEDGTSYNNLIGVRALAEDKDGSIWVGTRLGLFMLNEEYQNNPDLGFYQITVPSNDGTNNADYLLSAVDISAIAVDNAGRKWIGTNGNGIYLIDSDNMTEAGHFTTTDSGIISNTIQSIVIEENTGKVYIGTDKGLCSYQSEASRPDDSMSKDNVYAYPNPVKPDYTGPITITGLSYNADVKITTSNGALVAQGRSTGGSFLWDGNDLKGKRVASGIYMVSTSTESGGKGTVCKIAVIN